MLKTIGRGLLGRLLAYSVLALGFWLLFQGFLRPNVFLGVLGGAMILVGMYLIVALRRGINPPDVSGSDEEKEGERIDPIDRSR